MFEHFTLVIQYVRLYAHYMWRIRVLPVSLLLLIFIGGVVVSEVEGIKLGDGVYFAFITGLTVGYGDIAPHTTMGRIVSVIIALVGLVFTGLTVAVATRALHDTVIHIREAESKLD